MITSAMGNSPSILITASGRSGSTWVLDELATANRFRTVFEPLHPCMGEIASKYAGRYVPPLADEPELEEFFDRVLRGQIRHWFPNYRVTADRLIPTLKTVSSRRQLAYCYIGYKKGAQYLAEKWSLRDRPIAAKFIRSNLMHGWIRRRFDNPIVHLVRNPVSVVASRLNKENWNPLIQVDKILQDNRLAESGFLNRYAGGLELARLSDVHALAVVWCVDNVLPLTSNDDAVDFVAFHEDLLSNIETWYQLADAIGLEAIPKEIDVVRPDRLKNWKRNLDDGQLQAIASVLDCFNINQYSVQQAAPVARTVFTAGPRSNRPITAPRND